MPPWMAEYVPQNPTLRAAVAVVVLGLLASLLVTLLEGAKSGGKRPPTVRTLPLIGGLLEFLKVSGMRERSWRDAMDVRWNEGDRKSSG